MSAIAQSSNTTLQQNNTIEPTLIDFLFTQKGVDYVLSLFDNGDNPYNLFSKISPSVNNYDALCGLYKPIILNHILNNVKSIFDIDSLKRKLKNNPNNVELNKFYTSISPKESYVKGFKFLGAPYVKTYRLKLKNKENVKASLPERKIPPRYEKYQPQKTTKDVEQDIIEPQIETYEIIISEEYEQKYNKFNENEHIDIKHIKTLIGAVNRMNMSCKMDFFSTMPALNHKQFLRFLKENNSPSLLIDFVEKCKPSKDDMGYTDIENYLHFHQNDYFSFDKTNPEDVDILSKLKDEYAFLPQFEFSKFLINDMFKFMDKTEKMFLTMHFSNGKESVANCKTRWTYDKEKYASMAEQNKRLITNYSKNPVPFTHLIFTSHDTKQLDIAIENSKKSFTKSISMMRRMKSDFEYLDFVAPQGNGVIHHHVIVFCEFAQWEQDKLNLFWNEKYGEKDISFVCKVDSEYIEKHKDKPSKPTKNLRKLLSYTSKYSRIMLRSDKWKLIDWVWNSLVRFTNIRTSSCSKGVYEIMNEKHELTLEDDISAGFGMFNEVGDNLFGSIIFDNFGNESPEMLKLTMNRDIESEPIILWERYGHYTNMYDILRSLLKI